MAIAVAAEGRFATEELGPKRGSCPLRQTGTVAMSPRSCGQTMRSLRAGVRADLRCLQQVGEAALVVQVLDDEGRLLCAFAGTATGWMYGVGTRRSRPDVGRAAGGGTPSRPNESGGADQSFAAGGAGPPAATLPNDKER